MISNIAESFFLDSLLQLETTGKEPKENHSALFYIMLYEGDCPEAMSNFDLNYRKKNRI